MKILGIFLILFVLLATPVSASTFGDVPANHAAAEAIAWAASPDNGSFMLGDAAGNFNPNRTMDSFEAAISLAMAAGFQHLIANMTSEEQAFINQAYSRHSGLLNNISNTYPSWRRSANREIAFLLELGVLNQDDLRRFMIRTGENQAIVAPLTREAATAFVLRLAGLEDFAEPDFRFNDDAYFVAIYRRYAYLAYSLDVVASDSGYFRPRRHVTRAEFAQMCFNLLADPSTVPVSTSTSAQATSTSASSSPFASTIQGTIASVQSRQVQIMNESGMRNLTFAANPVIVIDDERKSYSDLQVNMIVAAGLNGNGQIISMLARTTSETTNVTPSPDNSQTVAGTSSVVGSLVNRYYAGRPILVIELSNGNIHSLAISEDTYIQRNGELGASWTDLRIGDNITAVMKANRLVSISAAGQLSNARGILEEIHITPNIVMIAIRQANGNLLSLVLPSDVYDVYDLRQGMDIRVHLDSREIYSLTIEGSYESQQAPDDATSAGGFVAYVRSIRHGHTIVVEQSENGDRHTIRVDGNTINTVDGNIFDFRTLRMHMRLYIVMPDEGNTASYITILS